MNKLIPLGTVLVVCFGFIAVEAQVDRGKDPNAPCVVVAGAVHVPMRLELKGKTLRVHEALAFAGGLTERSDGTIKLIRTEQPCYSEAWAHKAWPDRPVQVTELAFRDIPRADERTDPLLNPGDVLLVVESDPIYVSGRVAKPQAIYFKEPPSLLEAIAMAGGAVGVTGDTKVVIFRAGADRHYQEFLRVSLSELSKHPKRSPLLQRNDIIDVGRAGILIPPTSPPKFDAPPF